MSGTTQKNQPLALITPAWKDTLLMAGLTGQEGLSQLFQFEFEFVVENEKLKSPLPFNKVIGEPLVARFLQGGNKDGPAETRHFSGLCAEFSQGATDENFTAFRAVVVPKLWLLTRRAQSRIFQQSSVPQILEKVLKELLGGAGELSFQLEGTYEPRDYCSQYRETDFNFVSRLMEEEGIFYFFKHAEKGHEMVVSDTAKSYPVLRSANLVTGTEASNSAKVGTAVLTSWLKRQELRTGKVKLWDHCFELPHKHLEAESKSQANVAAGKAPHELALKANSGLEVYDWPGEYAQRFDGVTPTGGDRPADLQKIFADNTRTTKLRMQQQASGAVSVIGGGTWAQLMAGAKMTVETVAGDHRAKFASAEGAYILTSVTHFVAPGNPYRTGQAAPASYQNQFVAQPFDLPFRPARVSPKPVVHGSQSAVVVGPAGEEIFTDKYGRIKVQFHWDREGKNDANSSCWIRVVHPWAGRRWGTFCVPRIGQEVIVDFLEGDPDQPIVVGSVYNADQMQPYLGNSPDSKHKHDPKVTGIKTNTTPGGVGFNELRFDDSKGKEQVFIHAEYNMDERIKHDRMERVIHDRHLIVGNEKDGAKGGDQREQVYQDKHLHVLRHQVEHVEGNLQQTVGKGQAQAGGNVDILIEKNKTETIGGNDQLHVAGSQTTAVDGSMGFAVKGDRKESANGAVHLTVGGDRNEKVGGTQSLTVGSNQQEKVGQNHALEAGMEIHLKAGMKVIIEAGMQLSLKGPGGFIDIGPTGVTIQGTMVLINSGGAAGSGSGSSPQSPQKPDAPTDAQLAKPTKPTMADDALSGAKSN